jgi:type I restriction enzyme S subunit
MKRYNSYKDSGIEWIGEIPIDWSITKLKFISNIYNGNSLNEDLKEKYESDDLSNISYISTKDVDQNTGKINLENGIRIPKDDGNFKLAPKGSFVLCIEGANAGKKIGYLNEEAYFVNKLACFDYSNKFLYYYGLSENFKNQFFNSLSGLIGGVSISTIRNFHSTFPSIEEQTAIASFLDYKTNLIDVTIEKKKRLIELLKEKRQAVINEAVTKGLNANAPMKDSGIEWLGEIPEHWKVVRLKQIADAFGRIGYRGYTTEDIVGEDEGAITISPSNMKGDYMTFENCTYISWNKYEESPEIKIYNDDILMVKTGSTYGKVGVVKDLNNKATINPQVLVLKNVKVNPDYLYNLLRTNYMQYQVETNVIGSTIPTISQTKVLNFSLPLPPNDEIELIMIFIQNQMDLIDKMRKKIEIAIEKLQTYRQSLISEAVTGKIDVRDWERTKKLKL